MNQYNTHIPILLLVALLLAACGSDTETVSVPDAPVAQTPIAFSSYVGRSTTQSSAKGPGTRGSVSDLSNIATQGFGVFAMYTKGKTYSSGSSTSTTVGNFTPAFMKNVKVTGTTSTSGSATPSDYTWDYDLHRYWPGSSDEYVSFLAYAPYDENTKLVSTGGKESGNRRCIDVNINSDPKKQIDLMYLDNEEADYNALNQYRYYDSDGTLHTSSGIDPNGRLRLRFKHALVRIGFAITSSALADESNFNVDATESDARIIVSKVELYSSSGSFYQKDRLALYKTSSQNRWLLSGSAKGRQNFTFTEFANGTYSSNKWSPEDVSESNPAIIKGIKSGTEYATSHVGNSPEEYLFVLPMFQSNRSLRCKITYTVTYTSSPDISDEFTADSELKYGKFEDGKAYLVYIDIGSGSTSSLNTVGFDVEVEPWGDETDVTVNP